MFMYKTYAVGELNSKFVTIGKTTKFITESFGPNGVVGAFKPLRSLNKDIFFPDESKMLLI